MYRYPTLPCSLLNIPFWIEVIFRLLFYDAQKHFNLRIISPSETFTGASYAVISTVIKLLNTLIYLTAEKCPGEAHNFLGNVLRRAGVMRITVEVVSLMHKI